jgi:hypothetical protein
MRWLVLAMLVGCGDNVPEVPTTIVTVQVTSSCSGSNCLPVYFEGCSTYFPLVDAKTTRLEATSSVEPPLAALVQLQYAGDLVRGTYGDESPHLDYTLAQRDHVDVYAALDPSITLYRVDANGVAVEVDAAHLDAMDGSTLRFVYPIDGVGTVTETHVVAEPRLVAVDASTPGPLESCCSVGRPADAGLVALALLLIRRRRRRAD